MSSLDISFNPNIALGERSYFFALFRAYIIAFSFILFEVLIDFEVILDLKVFSYPGSNYTLKDSKLFPPLL